MEPLLYITQSVNILFCVAFIFPLLFLSILGTEEGDEAVKGTVAVGIRRRGDDWI
jgi:hypothetical protein